MNGKCSNRAKMYWSGLSVCALAPLFNTCYILQGFIKLSWCAISQLCLIQNLACDSLQRKMWNVFKALEMYSFNNSQSYMMYYKKTICKILHSRKDNFALFLLLLRTCFIIFFFLHIFTHSGLWLCCNVSGFHSKEGIQPCESAVLKQR